MYKNFCMQLNHSPMSLQSSANLNLWVALIVVSIFHHNSLRNRSKLTRSALLEPKLAPWEKLLNHGDNQSFLEVTGFTWRAFMKLERVLFPDSNLSTANYRRGRPSGLNNRGKVGLYLLYVNSSMRSKHLSMMFGIIPSTVSALVNFMMDLVVKKSYYKYWRLCFLRGSRLSTKRRIVW